MKIYQKYIISHILKVMLIVTLIFYSISFFIYWLKFLHILGGRHLSFVLWSKAMLFRLPEIFFYITPISLFISSVITYSNLIEEKEIIVFESSGVSRLKLAYPAIYIGFFFTISGFLLSFNVNPDLYRKFIQVKYDVLNSVYLEFQEKLFYHPSKDLTVYFDKKNSEEFFEGALIHDKRNQDNIITIFAEEAIKLKDDYKDERIFLLKRGIFEFENDSGKFSTLSFEKFLINLSDYTKLRKKSGMKRYGYNIKDLLFPQEELSEAKKNIFRAEAHQRIIWSMFNFIFVMIAATIIISTQFDTYHKFFYMFFATALIFSTIIVFLIAKNIAIYNGVIFFMYVPGIAVLAFCYFILYIGKNIRITEYLYYMKRFLYKNFYIKYLLRKKNYKSK